MPQYEMIRKTILVLCLIGIGLVMLQQSAVCCCKTECGPEYMISSPINPCPGSLVHHAILRNCKVVVTDNPCTKIDVTETVSSWTTIATGNWHPECDPGDGGSGGSGGGGGGGGGNGGSGGGGGSGNGDRDDGCAPDTCCTDGSGGGFGSGFGPGGWGGGFGGPIAW